MVNALHSPLKTKLFSKLVRILDIPRRWINFFGQ